MTFEAPFFLILLIFLPILFVWESRHWTIGQRGLDPLFFEMCTRKPRGIFLILLGKLLAFTLFVMLLARPVLEEFHVEEKKNGIDIVFVLDISRSMLAEDIAPNRIEKAKMMLTHFLEGERQDRIGLVIFAGKPFITSPLSYEYGALADIIDGFSVDSILQDTPGLSGTAFGEALLIAGEMFGTGAESFSGSRMVIALTDGRANLGIDPILSAKFLAEKNIRVDEIGIGSASGTLLYTTNSAGEKEYFRDEAGNILTADLDEATMRSIAEITGGKYWNGENTDTLDAIFREIQALTRRPIVTERVIHHQSLDTIFYPFLFISIVSVFLGEIFLIRKYRIPIV